MFDTIFAALITLLEGWEILIEPLDWWGSK
jgi:hypothetical protein